MSNSFGDEMRLTYDAESRLLRQWSTDGTDKSYGYDERGRVNSVTEGGVRTVYTLDDNGQITTAQSSDSTKGYRASYNARGQLSSLKSDKREVTFEYDARGNQTAFTYSDVGRFGLERDAAGRVSTERFPSGLNIYDEYDARGWLSKQSDNHGRSMTVERDASGAPVAYVRSDGKRKSAVRDEAGRVVAVTDFNGAVRRFAYNERGALTSYTDEHGKLRRYEYDRQGRLRSAVDDSGTRTNIDRDEHGRIRRVLTSAMSSASNFNLLLAHPLFQDQGLIDLGTLGGLTITGTIDDWSYTPVNGGVLGGGGENLLMEGAGGESPDVSGGGTMTEDEKFQCALAVVSCLVTIYGYIQAFAIIGKACADTVGLACVGILVAHPILASLIALQCADAAKKCHLS